MKKRTVTIDGRDFVIAPLNMAQVEDIFDNSSQDTDEKSLRMRAWSNIEASIRNAGSATTRDELRQSLDLPGFNTLHNAVLEVSGLKVANAGESKAVETT